MTSRLTGILVWPLAILLAALLAAGPIRAAGWPHEQAAGPFTCHADFSLAEYTQLLAEMAGLKDDLTPALGIPPPAEPIHLILFQRKGTYQEYIKRHFPHVPYRRALYIKQRGPGMVFAYRSAEFETDVRHECTHALLHAALPMVPLWLDEGLAEYFEMPPHERAYGHPHLGKVKWSARLGQAPRLEDLEKLATLSQMGQAQYRHAWAWVHFMLHGSPQAHDELVRFLADIQAHSPPGSLADRLRRRVPDLERQFLEHFRRWRS